MKNNYFILALALAFSSMLFAQEMKKTGGDQSGPTEFGRAQFLGVVPSLSQQMEEGTIIYGSSKIGIINDKKNVKPKSWSSPGASDAPQERAAASIRQTTAPGDHTRAPIINFEAHQVTTFAPSDPTGAAGPNHYITAINGAEFSIWNLDGTPTSAIGVNMTTIWPGESLGDPIIFYDPIVQRFVITQFSSSPNGFLVAVCQGPDPVNDGWYAYRFNTFGPATFPDYPKFSVWSDGYYITANKDQGSPTTSNVVYVLESEKMACGETAQVAGFPLAGVTLSGFFSPGAANIQGYGIPPAGNCPIFYMQDNGWPGVSTDALKFWEIDMDWPTIGNSTITQTQTLTAADGLAAFDNYYDGGSFSNIPQPGGGDVDALQATVNYMSNYRMFPGYNSLVLNWVEDWNGDDASAGIRWFELRQTSHGNPWTIFQQGTYAPSDNRARWSGSVALDGDGNIGMGFTSVRDVAGTANDENPSLRYTGRLVSDPINTMTVTEDVIVNGSAAESAGRYGDYSQLTVEPTDNRTFWFIGETFDSGGRKSHVGKFKIGADPAITVGIFDLQQPVLAGSSTQSIEVTVKNYGTTTQGNFPVQFIVDGGTPVTENYVGTLAPGASDVMTFSTTADMSAPGMHTVDVRTMLGTDTFPADDGFMVTRKAVLLNDLGVVAITAPVSGTLGATETVTVTIENFGSDPQSNFPVQYTLDAGTPVVETFAGTIAPGTTQSYSFATTADFSVGTIFTICGKTNLSSDQDATNDEFCENIANVACIPQSTLTPPAGCNLDGIKQFVLGTINVDDGGIGCNTEPATSPHAYADRTYLSTDLDRVAGNNIHVLQAMHKWDAAPVGAEQMSVWIDFNDNGTFEPSEQLLSGGTFTSGSVLESFDITIPTTANLGAHILRAKCIDTSSPGDVNDPCGNFSYGEVHDYSVNIIDTLSTEDNIFNSSNFNILYLDEANHFAVELKQSAPFESDLVLTVHNMLGKRVLDTELTQVNFSNGKYQYNLDLSARASGVYLVTLGNSKVSMTKRVIVK
jgi:hypothetical protein